MARKKECVAMLLAGGQGSRLYTLTEKTAKPAVPFGGKYRIIDFPLSNCIYSRIDTVGVLTQYQPTVLNEYIGNGEPWDLDRVYGGITILPPYQGKKGANWYKGTANAIYQNLSYIDKFSPEYVLILSGDHIYKMDYNAMLDYHKQKGADCTIAVIEVPLEEASRFGIMTTDDGGKILDFQEKPKKPQSTKASMGIYIFNKKVLFDYLIADEAEKNSSNDFGKDIIPKMLANDEKMYAYSFSGYWKDVGTIQSLWESNMDLLGANPKFDLYDRDFRIFFRNNPLPPHFVSDGAKITNSLLTEGCEIHGEIQNSIIFSSVKVGKDAIIKDSIIFSDTVIEDGATVQYSIIDSGVTIKSDAIVGAPREVANGITVIGSGVQIDADMVIGAGEMVGEDYLENLLKNGKG